MQVAGHEAGRQVPKLRAKVAQGDGFAALRLDGIIDEHNGLAQIGTSLSEHFPQGGDALVVDLGGIKRLNSVGVRDWVNWLRAIRTKFRTVVLFDCPAPVMNEVNFVKNFAEGAYITTFVAPLFCLRCQKEEARILETRSIRNGSRLAMPSFNCERTDCENALDDDEESYLGFMRTLPEGVADDRLMRLTEQARALLVAGGTPLADTPRNLDPHANGSAGRSQPLGQLGLQGVPRASESVPIPQAMASEMPAPPVRAGGDWLFIAAMVAMLAVLGVLIYLILTLE